MDLREAVQQAYAPALAMALIHATGDRRWLHSEYAAWFAALHRDVAPPDEYSKIAERFEDEACAALDSWLTRRQIRLRDPGDAVLARMMRVATGLDINGGYLPKLRSDLGLEQTEYQLAGDTLQDVDMHVVVVGAGISGLYLARRLQEASIDFTLLEQNHGVGGVWLDNTYPSCGLDTHPFLYSWEDQFPYPWSRADVRRDEILDYIRSSVDADLWERIRFSQQVHTIRWQDATPHWVLDVVGGDGRTEQISADAVIAAVGTLNQPKIPDLPGLDEFAGQAFHTARWPKDFDPTGRRVAVVGNGSSGVQVAPAIAPSTQHLYIMQRSPHWIAPRPPDDTGPMGAGERWIQQQVPFYTGWHRFIAFALADDIHPTLVVDPDYGGPGPNARNDELRKELETYIVEQVDGDPDLVQRVTPDYPPYAKRMVIDSGWYRMLTRSDVTLVTDPIRRITPGGILTDEGLHRIDTIVFATGFHGTRFLWPMDVVGPSGRPYVEESGGWEGVRAYLGVAYPGLPNFFTVQGPNSGVGHGGSTTYTSERQAQYIVHCLDWMRRDGIRTLECRDDACREYNEGLDAALDQMVWTQPGVGSRYRAQSGRVVMNHPWSHLQFWHMTSEIDTDAYHTDSQDPAAPVGAEQSARG